MAVNAALRSCWGAHTQLEPYPQIVIPQKSSTLEKWRAGCKRAQALGLAVAELRFRVCAAEEVEEGVCFDTFDILDLVFELVCRAKGRGGERVWPFEHDQRLLALGKQTIEFYGRLCGGIASDDQTVNCGVIGDPRGAVDAGRRQDDEDADDPAAHLQYASEEFEDLWRVVHIHCKRAAFTCDRIGPRRGGMIA